MNNTNNFYSSKREKYLLKKQRKEQERSQRERQKKIKKTISVSLISLAVILVAGGVAWNLISYFSNRDNQEVGQGTPKIEVSPLEYNAGTVSMTDNRFLKHTYEIKNNGDGNLKIDRIWTSCMCTTAVLKVGDKTSSEFGMHSNPMFWSQKIEPEEIGYLEVTFDTGFHGPQGTGSALREVYISSNDPQNEKAKVRLLAEVAP